MEKKVIPSLNADRRKLSRIDIIAATVFTIVVLVLTVWILKIDSSLNTVRAMQTVVLSSNQENTKSSCLIQSEVKKMREEVEKIYWLVLKETQRDSNCNGGNPSK